MKIRVGFVSNSSTSSFLMYGVEIDKGDIRNLAIYLEAAKNMLKENDDLKDDMTDDDIIDVVGNDYGDGEVIDFMLHGTKLDYEAPYEWDSVYVGLEWSGVLDDETGAQFKQRVKDMVEKVLGEKMKYGTHSGAWPS